MNSCVNHEPEPEQEFREVLHPSGLKMFVPVQKPTPALERNPRDGNTTCRYASKRCVNERAIKRNGDLHSFCELHRSKANQNQRRLEFKKRLQREGGDGSVGSRSSSQDEAGDYNSSSSGSAPSSPRFGSNLACVATSAKLGAITYHPHNDDDDVELLTERDYSVEPIPMNHDPRSQHAWLEAQYYQHYQQTQQQSFDGPVHTTRPTLEIFGYGDGVASRVPYTQPNPAYPQPAPSNQQLLEWGLASDFIGSSVAYAHTLTL